jgi:HSP20 family molecular chaperone IbpA
MNRDQSISVPIGHGAANGHNVHGGEPSLAQSHPAPSAPVYTPPIDIHEGPEGLILEADLPGVAESQLTIQLEDNVLSLHAKVAAPAPEDARVLHEEYRPGDFYRSFILSDEVERSRIAAELKDGVLKLTLPKAERAKTHRIEIKSS